MRTSSTWCCCPSLRWHYPDQVLAVGGDRVGHPLSPASPSSPWRTIDMLNNDYQSAAMKYTTHHGSCAKQPRTASTVVRRWKHFDAACYRHSCQIRSEFPVIVPNQIFGCVPIWSRFPQLLRHPRIGRKARHIYVNHLARLQLDEKKGKKGTEEEIRPLQKITSPHLCRMIAQERFPILSTSSLWTSVLHR